MAEKYGCVIDAAGRYVTFVIVLDNQVQHYTLKDGESLIDAKPPTHKQYAIVPLTPPMVISASMSTWARLPITTSTSLRWHKNYATASWARLTGLSSKCAILKKERQNAKLISPLPVASVLQPLV